MSRRQGSNKESPLNEGKPVTVSYCFSAPFDIKDQKVALNQRTKVFKGTGVGCILTRAAQKLHSETRNIICAIQRTPAFAHLRRTAEKHGICWLITMTRCFNLNNFTLVFCE